jgi:predicted outer membrane repeat protein
MIPVNRFKRRKSMGKSTLTFVIYCILVLLSSAHGDTYVVNPEGTGDFSTIQAAVDAVVEGDVIELTDGEFKGDGNRNIDFRGKGITIRSQSGNAEACIINPEGIPGETRRGFYFKPDISLDSVVRDLTIYNGMADEGSQNCNGGGIRCEDATPWLINIIFKENEASGGGAIMCEKSSFPLLDHVTFTGNSAANGAAIYCFDSASPTLSHCIFEYNLATNDGGGVRCHYGSIIIDNCIFRENVALANGGGINAVKAGAAIITNCTFSGNQAPTGAGICFYYYAGELDVANTIVAYSDDGEGIYIEEGLSHVIRYCDLFGNEGGDWVGAIEDELGKNGNISVNPHFVSYRGYDFLLHPQSSCIDMGDPDIDDTLFDRHPRIPPWYHDGKRSDIGAYGGPNNHKWFRR